MTGDHPRDLIITVYGLYSRSQHNWLSVSALVKFISSLGINEPAVRSSIYRLKQSGILSRVKIGSADGYALSDSAVRTFAEGDARIFRRRRANLDDGWLVVSFSIPESERAKRHLLRTELIRLDFGNAAPGLWVAPGNLLEETKNILRARELDGYVYIFRGEFDSPGDLASSVQTWWNFDEFNAMYEHFIDRFGPSREAMQKVPPTDPEAFLEYVRMLTAWRRIKDPGLPEEVLTRRWKGLPAAQLFAEASELLAEPARRHANNVIAQSRERVGG